MTALLLARRNLRIYFRDRTGVFFSLLSPLILLGLYVFFLGGLQVNDLQEAVPSADPSEVTAFVNAWVFSGITMITALTTGLAALSIFVEDSSTGRFRDFLVSPIKRSSLILGYMIASFTVAMLMTVATIVLTQLYTAAAGQPVLSLSQLLQTLGYVVVSAAAFSALSSFVVTFLRTTSAFAALSTIVGTVIGFLAGAYIPVGALPAGAVNVMNALPFAQSAMLIRQPTTAASLDALAGGQPAAIESIEAYYGISASVGDTEITTALAVGLLLVVFVVFAVLGAWRIGRRIR